MYHQLYGQTSRVPSSINFGFLGLCLTAHKCLRLTLETLFSEKKINVKLCVKKDKNQRKSFTIVVSFVMKKVFLVIMFEKAVNAKSTVSLITHVNLITCFQERKTFLNPTSTVAMVTRQQSLTS